MDLAIRGCDFVVRQIFNECCSEPVSNKPTLDFLGQFAKIADYTVSEIRGRFLDRIRAKCRTGPPHERHLRLTGVGALLLSSPCGDPGLTDGLRPNGARLALSEAFSAVASAASPLTKSAHLISNPLRRPFKTNVKPVGESVSV